MKTLFSKAGLLAFITLLTGAGLLFAGLEENQPRMEAAVKFLQDAKKADNPLPDLNKARNELRKASHNKAGWRLRAIRIVSEAIDLANANGADKQNVTAKCDKAIAEIHTGMAKAY